MLKPREAGHAPFKERYVSPVIMPAEEVCESLLYNTLFDDDRKNLKKREFHYQVLG